MILWTTEQRRNKFAAYSRLHGSTMTALMNGYMDRCIARMEKKPPTKESDAV